MALTWQCPLMAARTVSSLLESSQGTAPTVPLGLWSGAFPALPGKPVLPNPASLEAETASLGAHPNQHGPKCKSAVPAPSPLGLQGCSELLLCLTKEVAQTSTQPHSPAAP